jgi:hypothetical protein
VLLHSAIILFPAAKHSMNSFLLQRFVEYAPFVVAATATLFLLAHGLHLSVLDGIGPGPPN